MRPKSTNSSSTIAMIMPDSCFCERIIRSEYTPDNQQSASGYFYLILAED
jgi:hypothetical protein